MKIYVVNLSIEVVNDSENAVKIKYDAQTASFIEKEERFFKTDTVVLSAEDINEIPAFLKQEYAITDGTNFDIEIVDTISIEDLTGCKTIFQGTYDVNQDELKNALKDAKELLNEGGVI